MIDILLLLIVIYYIFTIFCFLYNSYTFMRKIYSGCYYIFSGLSRIFTKTANYFYIKMENVHPEEERYLFDSESEYDESESMIELTQNGIVYSEIYKEKYPTNFTSIYLNET